MDLNKLFDEIRKKESFTSRDLGASSDEINRIENDLNVKLPNDYKLFLKTFGYVWWFGIELYGISDDADENVLFQTIKARNEKLPIEFNKLPLEGVIISRYGGGGYYFLYSEDCPRSGEVSLIIDETFGNEVQKWRSFKEFLEYLNET